MNGDIGKKYFGLNGDQAKLFTVWFSSFIVTSSLLLYFSTRDSTLKSGWLFILYILFAVSSSYLYFSIII